MLKRGEESIKLEESILNTKTKIIKILQNRRQFHHQ